MNQDVAEYIKKTQPWQAEICNTLRNLVLTNVPDAEERLQYGKPHYLKNGSYLAVFYASKDKVSFMLFNATKIPEIKGLVRSMGNGERKTIDIREGQPVDYKQLATFIHTASQK